MTGPNIKPKYDFTPATSQTAYESADALADCTKRCVKAMGVNDEDAEVYHHQTFMQAMDGAAMLQNFMNARWGMR